MDKINILNKRGMLSDEDRKAPLERGLNYFTFKTCIDLSSGIDVFPYGTNKKVSIDHYSQDVASFIAFWNQFVAKDLNGFPGFANVKFRLHGVELVDTNKQ